MLNPTENELLSRVGAGTEMGEYVRRFWVPCLLSEEIPTPDSPPVRVRIYGEEMVAFRETSGKVGLLDRYCPHRLASLFFGRNEEGGLRCAYHGWKFDVSGACVDMPSEPADSNFAAKVTVRSYPVREAGGVIWGYLGPAGTEPPLPELTWASVPEAHRYVSKTLQRGNWTQALEGGIDSSHISFLHAPLDKSTFRVGIVDESLRTQAMVDPAPRYFVDETPYGARFAARRTTDTGDYYWRITQWLLPFYQVIPAEPNAVVTGNCYVPMDDENTLVFRVSWHQERALTAAERHELKNGGFFHAARIPGTYLPTQNRENDYLIDREVQRTLTFSGIHGIQAQDQAMLENMKGGPIADRRFEHLGTSDMAIITARRRLLREAKALADGVEPAAPQDGAAYGARSASVRLAPGVAWEEAAAAMLAPRTQRV
ncbi:MAG: Rieske 2Fe-2S domain-containing protein [Chloroflexota bacterium]